MELALKDVTCVRALPDGGDATILRDVNVVIPAGELTVVLGPSGAGKSTLLRLFNRLDDPTSGEVRVNGRPAREWDVQELRRQVAFVFQTPAFVEETVRQDVTYGLRRRREPAPAAPRRAVQALERVGLDEEFLDRRVDSLSVGQQQRAALARALIGEPRAILADEPTAALDPASARVVLDLLTSLAHDEGLTVVMVTHDLALAESVGDHLVLVLDGRLAEASPAAEFFRRPATETGQAFLEEARRARH